MEMRILCFGDSNTYGYDPRSYFGGRYGPEDRWVEILGKQSGWETINCGQNGREIPRNSFELAQTERLLSEYAPDVLVLMLGTNDLLQGASVEVVISRIEAFLEFLRPRCGRILLAAPPQMKRGAWVPEETLVQASGQLAGQYRTLARENGIAFADAGEWGIDLTFDGVHFSESGHHTFAEGILHCLAGAEWEDPPVNK